MKKIIYVMISLFCLGTCKIVSGQSTEEKASLSTQIDSISYAMGADLADQFSELGITINPQGLLKGFNDLSSKSEKELSASMAIIRTFSHEIQTRKGKPFTDIDPPTVNINSLSYAIGLDYGKRLKDGGLEMNAQEVFDGCLAALNNSSALDGDQIEIQMKTLSTLMQEKKAAKTKIIIEKNKREGAAFLAVNGKKKGVITTASGLQYKVIRPGSGVSPKAESTVKVHYEGKLLDGTIFDSSIQRGKPIEFPLGGVIKGWTEGVQLMKNGSKFQFYIPAELAYGERGSPPNIGPSTTLIFDVELLSFK